MERPRSPGPRVVSVAMVAHRHGRYVRQAMESVCSQELPPGWAVELLVGVDLCSDATASAARRAAADFASAKVGVEVRERASRWGGSANFVDLLRAARGELIAVCDGDDFWWPGKLAAQIAAMESMPDVQASYGNGDIVDSDGVRIGEINPGRPDALITGVELLEQGNFLPNCSTIFRRGAIEGYEFPDYFLDVRLHLLCASKGLLNYSSQGMCSYRVHAAGAMAQASDAVNLECLELVALWSASMSAGQLGRCLRRCFDLAFAPGGRSRLRKAALLGKLGLRLARLSLPKGAAAGFLVGYLWRLAWAKRARA